MAVRRSRAIRLELGGALAPPLAKAHGVTRREVEARAGAAHRALLALLERGAASGFLALPRRRAVLREVESAARRWRRRGLRDWIHVGIGGSALGTEVLLRALLHPRHALLPPAKRGGPRVHLIDNVDPETLAGVLDVADLRRVGVHVVSKSGGTVETAAGFQVLRDALGRGWAKRCVFSTGRSGALRELAEAERVETLALPEDVGGRFSALTAAGLLTPAVAGVDVASVFAGGRRMQQRIARARPEDDPAAVAAALHYLLAEERGKPIHVLMPYGDALEPLARWYVQLAGESLGKRRGRGAEERCVGPTPLPARGSTDQHSQVQLFVDGPPDKCVSFVRVERDARPLTIPGGAPAPYLEDVSLGDLLRAEQRGTAVALARAGRPSATWSLPALDGDALGQLLVALEAQVAAQAALYRVNAFDQPGVEAGKVAAWALIGREGYEREREAIEADAPPEWVV